MWVTIDLAEDALQDAFVIALDRWPGEGVPEGLSSVLCNWHFSRSWNPVFIHDYELIDGGGPVQDGPCPSF